MKAIYKKNWFVDARVLALLTGLVTFVVYLPALKNGFVTFDDNFYLYENDHIRNLNGEFLSWAFTEFYRSNWHPLTWLSHALDYAVWGLNPVGHHLTNNLLHSINTVLVVFLSHKVLLAILATERSLLSGKNITAFIALMTGLLFGLHPLHVESVAWISERKDLLCAFFYLLSLLFYLRLWQNSPSGIKKSDVFLNSNYLICLVLFAFALMSKPMAVSLPFVILLIDWLFCGEPNRRAWKARLVVKIPFLLLAFTSAILTIAAQKSGGAVSSLAEVPISDRLWVASNALIAYLHKMVWPADLMPFYPYPKTVVWNSIHYLGSALLVLSITLIALLSVRRHRSWAVAWGFYIVTLAPVIGIVKVGDQAMADRYTYLPSIAPFMLMAVALVWCLNRMFRCRSWKRLRILSLSILTVSLMTSLSFLTHKQIQIWRSGDTLWNYVIQHDDQIPLAYQQLGISLFDQSRYAEAAEMTSKALILKPLDAELLNNLAICYLELGNLTKAKQIVTLVSNLYGDRPYALNTLGEIYLAQKDYPNANKAFFQAMQIEPENPLRLFNLAISFDKLNNTSQACIYWRRYMILDASGQHDVEITQHLAELGCPVEVR